MSTQVTDAFRWARRRYTASSIALISWNFRGIESLGLGGVEVSLDGSVLTIGIPAVLLYFLYRTELEWARCPEEAKNEFLNVMDRLISHLISVGSVLLCYLPIGLGRSSGSEAMPMFVVRPLDIPLLVKLLIVTAALTLVILSDTTVSQSIYEWVRMKNRPRDDKQ